MKVEALEKNNKEILKMSEFMIRLIGFSKGFLLGRGGTEVLKAL
jgi:hypothetical protein